MYDLCFRSIQGLPLPARALTAYLIESILGRLLRTEDVVVCSYVWMSNHVHMQLFSLDCAALISFYGGLMKRITDFLKRLLGLHHLRLWEDRPTVSEVLDLDAAIDRIVYTYLNPVRAGLVRRIDDYTGCNTWREFLSAPANVDAIVEKEVPWVRLTDISPLTRANPSVPEERRILKFLEERTSKRETHTIRIMPFKWLEAFKIIDPIEIERIRRRIISRVREEEETLSAEHIPHRPIEGFIVKDTYIPRKKERKVFMYGSTKEIRCQYLAIFDVFIRQCAECFELLKQGYSTISWPPECFKPPGPKLCNAF